MPVPVNVSKTRQHTQGGGMGHYGDGLYAQGIRPASHVVPWGSVSDYVEGGFTPEHGSGSNAWMMQVTASARSALSILGGNHSNLRASLVRSMIHQLDIVPLCQCSQLVDGQCHCLLRAFRLVNMLGLMMRTSFLEGSLLKWQVQLSPVQRHVLVASQGLRRASLIVGWTFAIQLSSQQ